MNCIFAGMLLGPMRFLLNKCESAVILGVIGRFPGNRCHSAFIIGDSSELRQLKVTNCQIYHGSILHTLFLLLYHFMRINYVTNIMLTNLEGQSGGGHYDAYQEIG